MSALKVTDLLVGYENTPVAEKMNFEISQGDYVCIIGKNGAGKSTLVKTLLHLQKPISGTIEYGEEGIGYLPQQTVVQKDFPASVWEIVMSGNVSKLGKRFFYKREDKLRARKNMKRMNIWDLKRKCYRNLSGGQQQRVLLARALCASSQMLFLDEPVTGLDPQVTAEFYGLLKELNENGMTIIMVSHDFQAAMEYASHILHVDKKEIFFGTKEEYQKSALYTAFEHSMEEAI